MEQTTAQPGQGRGRLGIERANRRRRHEQALIQAEVRRLMHAIGPFGVLRRDALARAAGAEHWPGRFDQALQAAVDQGRLEARPFDYYSDARHSRQADARRASEHGS
jgi:hypothetical protein